MDFKINEVDIDLDERKLIYAQMDFNYDNLRVKMHYVENLPLYEFYFPSKLNTNRTLSIVSGVHGDEALPIVVSKKLIREILLNGNFFPFNLQIFPCCNTSAFWNKTKKSPIDNLNLNSSFGTRGNTYTLKLAKKLRELLSNSEAIIDMHSGSPGQIFYPHVRINHPSKYNLEFASYLNFKYILHEPYYEQGKLKTGLITSCMPEDKIPTVCLELGEGLSFTKTDINNYYGRLTKSLQNITRARSVKQQVFIKKIAFPGWNLQLGCKLDPEKLRKINRKFSWNFSEGVAIGLNNAQNMLITSEVILV